MPTDTIQHVIEAWHINTHLGYIVLHDNGTRGVTPEISLATKMSTIEAWLCNSWLNMHGEPKLRYNITRDMVAYTSED